MAKITYVAHRGQTVSTDYLENTVEIIQDAINNSNVGAIEIDIQETKDHELVLMNYKNLNDIVSKIDHRNRVCDYDYEELSKLNITASVNEIVKTVLSNCSTGYDLDDPKMIIDARELGKAFAEARIPKLEEILSLPRNGKELIIEIKAMFEENEEDLKRYVALLASKIREYNPENITFIGRDVNVLLALKEEFPQIPCMPVIGYNDVEKVLSNLDGASVALNHLDLEVPGTGLLLYEYLLQYGKELNVWNIRTPEQYEKLRNMIGESFNNFSVTGDYADLLPEYEENYQQGISAKK